MTMSSSDWERVPDDGPAVSGALAAIEADRRVAIAAADAAAEVGAARVAALGFVSRLALYDMAVLSDWERDTAGASLRTTATHLHMVSHMTAVGLAAVVVATTAAMVDAGAGQ
jgi:hypothetical protein